jgi:hypothetical protein
MNKLNPNRPNLETLLLAMWLAGGVLLGCSKAGEPSSPPSPAPSNAGVALTNHAATSAAPAGAASSPNVPAPLTDEGTPTTLTPSTITTSRVERLIQSFQSAPPETRARIDDALATFKAGQKKEAIAKLKLVDADSPLTAEQQTSILNLILEMRK